MKNFKRMSFFRLITGLVLCVMALPISVNSQNGDQILDGIGETALVARYRFDGDARDWSRNNLHATAYGDYKYIFDEQFEKALSLSGGDESFVTIPAESVQGEESLSMSGWVYLNSTSNNHVFFDFGKSKQSYFTATYSGTENNRGFKAQIMTKEDSYQTSSSVLVPYKWNHLAVVIDIPSRVLCTYVNGKLVSKTTNVEIELNQIFDYETSRNNKLFIGKSISSKDLSLNARIYDFRIYRIALNEDQVANIHNRALKIEETVVRTRNENKDGIQQFPETTPQLYNEFLTEVPVINVETVVGELPRLPRHLKGIYKNDIEGPAVRVIWPSPTDNSEVLTPGQYTVIGRISGTDIKPKAIVTVKNETRNEAPERQLEEFRLDQVFLEHDTHNHETKFIENQNKFLHVLSQSNPDDFLYMFRNAFAQKQPKGAKPLGVWDSQETKLRGHATGHYLTAIAQAYSSTAYAPELQAEFAAKMEYMVNVLYNLSQLSGKAQTSGGKCITDPLAVPPAAGSAGFNSDLSADGIRTDYWNWGLGYISAYPPDQFIMLENGAGYGTDNSKVWAPYYTLHKILAGLMDIYDVSGNEKALEIVQGMGNWVHARLENLPTNRLISMWNSYIAGEYGGMNEAMARLYRLSGDEKYMETAKLFDNIRLFYGDSSHTHGLAKNVDMLRGLHSNQHIPQIVGAIEVYRNSKDPKYYHIADNFWNMSVNDYMYSIGGVAGARNPANAECYTKEPSTLYENGFSEGGQNETCATYNMLKLSRNLFLYNHRAELMDYYERGLYNHILASVAENSPANTYHVPLTPGSVKHFSNADMSGFTCCNGTAIESSTKLQNTIYFKSTDNKALYVNLFVPSTLNWEEKNVSVTQKTSFPKEDFTVLTINGSAEFELNVRVPHWATKGFSVKINGKVENVVAEPGTYLAINRLWHEGDEIELQMPFSFHLEPVMDQQNIASLFYGPVLLAAQEDAPRKEWRKITLDAKDISNSITGDTNQLIFKVGDVTFKPFFDTYGRHSVYLNVTLK